ncbi:MAG: immunoglobulin domain-containing protein [Phycisphaerae bacterium]|nr:immunoglobulin domain-containing protein [Phycisphaerae bacterium]
MKRVEIVQATALLLAASSLTVAQNCGIWVQRHTANAPSRRNGHSMCYDMARQRVLLFGGYGESSSPSYPIPSNETWEFDGTDWTLLPPTSSTPNPTRVSLMAFDLVRNRTVLLSRRHDWYDSFTDTYEWNGVSWNLRSATAPPISSIFSIHVPDIVGSLFFHGGRQRVVTLTNPLAGASGTDIWMWNGFSWTNHDATLENTVLKSAVYDSHRGVIVAVDRLNGRIWEHDGTAWHHADAPRLGQFVLNPQMVFQPNTGRTLLRGFLQNAGPYVGAFMFSWDGEEVRVLDNSYEVRVGPMVFDVHRAEVVMFSGIYYGGGGQGNETWVWRDSTAPSFSRHPDHEARVPGESVSFHVQATGSTPLRYQWRKDGQPISDGPRHEGTQTADMTIIDMQIDDAGWYDCIVMNDCQNVSDAAYLDVACEADFNRDGGVDGGDVNSFFAAWESGDFSADRNQDGGIDGLDVESFFDRWELGC